MPLIKYLFDRRIVATRRRGNLIYVKLAAAEPGKPLLRTYVTPEFYAVNRKCHYVPKRPGKSAEPPQA